MNRTPSPYHLTASTLVNQTSDPDTEHTIARFPRNSLLSSSFFRVHPISPQNNQNPRTRSSMPLFITDEELESLRSNDNNVTFIVSKADSFITNLQRQLETVKAQSEASSITAEQTCSLLEQKYISLSSDFEKLESQNAELNAAIEQNLEELAVVKSEKHRIHLESIEKDGTIERLSAEVSEIHKSKRQLLGMIEQKDTEITEKNTTIKSYLDKIVNLTEAAALKQSQLHEREAEFARSQATCARLSQEKELIEKHNVWLNEELTTKVHDLIQVRKAHAEAEADISAKLADAEKSYNECSSSLKWNKERVKELEGKLASLQEELCYSKTTAAENEERFTAELSTVSKLVELYKESSEEWSRKAGDFEGVIKALETHLAQVENDYREKLEKEVSARLLHEKAAADLKEKLNKCDVEIENYRKANELSLLPISSFTQERWTDRVGAADGLQDSDHMIVPKIPVGVSGTALAASLLRDGWSLAKMYEKYQEAVDALRHESMGRKQSQAILERVLYEIEQKAELILDERAEHERMVEAYSAMNQKLENSTSEQVKLEGMIQELKAEIRRAEREYDMAQKEIVDLQKQVTVLLKECRDIQLRCGSTDDVCIDQGALLDVEANDLLNSESVISERLTYKDINELVEHNVKLRSLVRSLSDQNEKRDTELREMFEMELRKQTDEASSKVAVVLQRAEEQGQMIEALHRSVAMYKRLYEEAQKLQASHPHYTEPIPDSRRTDVMLHLEDSQDTIKKAHDQLVQRVKHQEEQLDMSRKETISLRLERDKLSMESKFAQEKLDSFMKEFEHMREEMNGLRARNVEFSQLVVDYQRKVRESSDSLQATEELSRKLTMEVSFLKHEKESLLNSEKMALAEARNLSERLSRLQVSMETEHCVEAAREETRLIEKKKQEEYMNKLERDLAQAMKELQEKRDIVQTLTIERQNAMTRKEELEEQLVDALRERALAETRAAVAEMRYSDMEANTRASHSKGVVRGDGPSTSMTTVDVQNETVGLHQLKEEIERLKEEEKANKDHMLQYKNIAQVNELALKQVESAHERYKTEVDRMKKSHEDEVLSLRERISELENGFSVKFKEAATVVAGKEEALASALAEIDILKAESSAKISQIAGMEVQISSLKEDLEKEHQRWRDAQNNYERQVILQSDTIQELTKTSRALSLLQDEISQLRKLSDTQKSENDILKEKLASEISLLAKLKDEAERKFNEVNEQNKILHSRLESLHIKLADNERTSVGSSGSPAGDAQSDNGLQTVVTYLRRSKEIAETEISLLRQEKLRLQSQLESALKASETAQAQLHTERVKSRELLFSDEEFKALQIQVRELNLLRESNLQLREENKHNFEECQRLRELAQKASAEMDHLETVVEEKKIEVDSCRKEIEILGVEKGNLENRIAELLGMYKNIDIEDYSRMKEDFHQMQVKLKTVEAELDECRKLLSEKQDSITSLELQLKSTRVELTERETRIKESLQTEATLKLELEKQRRVTTQYKRKFENLTKEKEEWTKEKQTLVKQEESRQGKRPLGDTSSEQAMKEKDARIQILERTIEREREELRKEKEEHRNEKEEHRKEKEDHLKEKEEHHKEKEKYLKEKEEHRKEKEEHRKEKAMRLKSQRIFEGFLNRANQERAKLVDELERHKQVCRQESGVVETASYYKAVDNLNESVKSFISDDLGAPDHALDTSRTDRPAAAAPQVVAQTLPAQPLLGSVGGPSQTKPAEEKERRATLAKPHSENRKLPRRLVRPNLGPQPQEASGDTEMAESEGSVHAEGKKDPMLPNLTSARKRGASESGSELREESEIPADTSNILLPPLSKKSRAEFPQEGNEGHVSAPPQSHDVDESSDAAGDQPRAANDSVIVAGKDDVCVTAELDAESKESPLDVLPTSETQINSTTDASEGLFDNIREPEDGLSEGLKDGEEQDPQQTLVETESDREEGELPPDVGEEQDGVDASFEITSSVPGEVKHDLASVADVPSPAVDEELDFTTGELFETTSSTVIVDEKIDTGEGAEELAEDSDKSTNEYDQGLETDKSPKAAFGAVGSSSPTNVSEHTAPDQANITGTPAVEEEESPAVRSTTINLTERALAKAELRRKGLVGSPTISKDSSTTAPKREVGARGVRGTRGVRGRGARGRRPTSSDGQG